MLMQTSHPCTTKVAPSFSSDLMLQGSSSDLMPENQANYSTCRQNHLDSCGEPFPDGKSDALNYTRNCSQPSTSTTMSFVYQRRRRHKNSVPFFKIHPFDDTKPSNGDHSAISSVVPSVAAQEGVVSVSEQAIEAIRSPVLSPVECNTVATVSSNECSGRKEAGSEEALITNVDRVLNVCNTNENCSSSKSNLNLSTASLKTAMDDAGECSSSGAILAEKVSEEISERDICIKIIKAQGILDKVWTRRGRATAEKTGVRSEKYCSKSCKLCRQLDSTSNMLVCDGCQDAFHMSCCNRNMIPVGEWLCSSCLKKKQHKILKEKSTNCNNSVNIGTETGENRSSEPEGELGSLELMLIETEPHMSNVRIGDEFQANVPNWCGLIDDDSDLTGEPLEMNHSNNRSSMQVSDSAKPLNLSSIGNWLQCREVISGTEEGGDEIVCAKWRRAPLFEVQTDEFECFHCVLWDQAHADCAVPQELDTGEVMKQLKYIETLRPRLAAKRRKLNRSKSSSPQDQSRSR